MPEQITETGPVLEAVPGATGRIKVTLITPGWGSSGYYSPAVLEAAARDRVFPSGTQAFLDHPTTRELHDRPERSVKDLAAVLLEDAQWDGTALVADAQLLPPHAETLRQPEMAAAVGMSIRATADLQMGEADGRRGQLVTQIYEGLSVDFVTRAGRGGRYQVIESATPTRVVGRAIGRGVAEATAEQLRGGLQQALRDSYGGDQSWVWVRDFDATRVWFEHETPDRSGVYEHTFTADATGAVTLTGQPVEVRQVITYVPVDPAGDPPPQESEETPMPNIEEGRLAQLEEAAGRVSTLEAERDTARREADQAKAALAEAGARQAARPAVAAKIAESKVLAARTQARLVESIITALPVTDGKITDDALAAAVKAAVDAAEAEVADYRPAGAQYGVYGSATEAAHEGEFNAQEAAARRARVFGYQPVKGA